MACRPVNHRAQQLHFDRVIGRHKRTRMEGTSSYVGGENRVRVQAKTGW
jgi:hypothetical protein